MAVTPLDRTINNQSPTFLFLFSAIVVAAVTLTLTGNPLDKNGSKDVSDKELPKRISRSKRHRMEKIKELKAVGQAAEQKKAQEEKKESTESLSPPPKKDQQEACEIPGSYHKEGGGQEEESEKEENKSYNACEDPKGPFE